MLDGKEGNSWSLHILKWKWLKTIYQLSILLQTWVINVFFDHINLQSQAIYIDKEILKKLIHIILEENGSGYASGDIAQVIIQNKNKNMIEWHWIDGFWQDLFDDDLKCIMYSKDMTKK